MKRAISVIIVTKNRPEQLTKCLQSLQKSKFTNYELIVIDQSTNKDNSENVLKEIQKFQQAKKISSKKSGKSKGLNLGIKLSTSPILAFTDDDCIISKDWLENIFVSFKKNKRITAVFGKTLPYQPHKNKNLICPCTFTKKSAQFVTQPCQHWKNIGFGNNMAWRKKFFKKFGLFKEWLGPGSIGSNAEDAEISLRALINKQPIFYNPKILIHHNKWQTKKEHEKQELSYICGENACYGYLALSGYKIGKEVIKENFLDSLFIFRKNSLIKSISKLRGLMVAFYEKIKSF